MPPKTPHGKQPPSWPRRRKVFSTLWCLAAFSMLVAGCAPSEAPIQAQSAEEVVSALVFRLAEGEQLRTEDYEEVIDLGGAAVDPLLQTLAVSPDPHVRERVAYVLGEIGDPRAADTLIGAFQSGSVGRTALQALEKIGDPRVVEFEFIDWVESGGGSEGPRSILELGKLSAQPWVSLLENENPEVRSRALTYLWMEGVASELEDDPAPLVEALLRYQLELEASFETQNELDFARQALESMGPQAIPALISILQGEDERLRFPAAYALGHLGGSLSAEALVAALESPDRMESLAGYWGLGQWPWEDEAEAELVDLGRVFDNLVAILGESDLRSHDRAQAADLIARSGDPRSLQVLAEVLESDDPQKPTFGILLALGQLGDPEALPLLAGYARSEDEKEREAAIAALGIMGGEGVLDVLVEGLRDDVREVQREALSSLNKLDEDTLAPLLDALTARDLETVARAYLFFISRGEPGSEAVMAEALLTHGDLDMAKAFLSSDHEPLEEAARQWAAENGYTVFEIQVPAGVGGGSVHWGGGN